MINDFDRNSKTLRGKQEVTDTNDLRLYGQKQKFARLQREIKKHPLNCHKRQKALLQLQRMIFEV